ncbi:HAD family hydrolase [Streptomyces sp. SPB074]|uniref:HAD family hydrolase n=1 Tax=Streptomyces sp. (strain SPB074) TaxID=465543 RepID=UPI0001D1E098|nr:HAD family hydrolase [Streptomyces sp. SPB074]EFG64909.1 hydrolase [Streptomyces sp. SPB074]
MTTTRTHTESEHSYSAGKSAPEPGPGQHPERDAAPSAPRAQTPAEPLAALLDRTRWVLLDFDGPVCRLFAGHPARGIARRMASWLDARPGGRALAAGAALSKNPQALLRAVGRRDAEGGTVRALESLLTDEELTAAESARPTPYLAELLHTWYAAGRRFAVTTNNSPLAARRYLERQGLDGYFADQYHGRGLPLRLKPDPYCLTQAVKALEADPRATLMIGDEPGDAKAARAAGIPFLGYAERPPRRAALRAAGARHVVASYAEVLWGAGQAD